MRQVLFEKAEFPVADGLSCTFSDGPDKLTVVGEPRDMPMLFSIAEAFLFFNNAAPAAQEALPIWTGAVKKAPKMTPSRKGVTLNSDLSEVSDNKRLRTILNKHGIYTLKHLLSKTLEKISKLHNVGPLYQKEIRDIALKHYSLFDQSNDGENHWITPAALTEFSAAKLDTLLTHFTLSRGNGVVGALRNNGIRTVKDLIDLPKANIERLGNVGYTRASLITDLKHALENEWSARGF
jgi:DNA-directed RNA polymerase alpha subunit